MYAPLETCFSPGFVEEVKTSMITPSRRALRDTLEPLGPLMSSIAALGLLQPILLRPADHNFEVVAGNRRLEACKRLGMRKILCHIVTLDDREAYEASLIENIQRSTLNPIEEARAFRKYVDELGYGGEVELAHRIGKSPQYISQRIRLLSLPRQLLVKILNGSLTSAHASELIGLPGEVQEDISARVLSENLSTRETRELVRQAKSEGEEYLDFESSALLKQDNDESRILNKCIAILRVALIRYDDILEHTDSGQWLMVERLSNTRHLLHQQIDEMIRLKELTKRYGGECSSLRVIQPKRVKGNVAGTRR